MDQEKNGSRKVMIIIILIMLAIVVFCGGMLFGKMNAQKTSKAGNSNATNGVQKKITNTVEKEGITDDQLYSIYSTMDYSDDIKITQFDTYHIATYNDDEYYVIDDDYKGEYDIITLDLYSDEYGRFEITDEEMAEFKVDEVMNYASYTAYCEKWNLEKKYNDEEMNYIVFSNCSPGVPSYDVRLSEVEYKNNAARLYFWSNGDGVVDACAAYVIVVPTKEKVEKVEWKRLYTQSHVNYLISYKLYGEDYNGKYNVEPTDDKPIIYLYPEEETKVSVKLGYSDKITCSYPKYVDGWNVLAKPNGDLVDLDTGKNLYALYYESQIVNKFEITNEGFVVKGEDTSTFLEEKLATLGLTEREAEEFIVYWLPKLEQNKYNYIRFATEEEINENMPLDIRPKPDSLIRVLMVFKGLDESIDVSEQSLKTPERNGFVAVEWGGTEIQ